MPRQAPRSPLKIFLLGTFRLERGGHTIRLPTRQAKSLLAFLMLHPEQQPREKLASLFWGDSTDAQARNSLRTALKTLRKELGDDLLLADRESVQLNPAIPFWVDAREFQIADFRLPIEGERAVSQSKISKRSGDPALFAGQDPESKIDLYRGELLAGFYDEWIPPERERLQGMYVEALLKRAESARAGGEYEKVIELAKKVLEVEGTNEQAHRHLMFCYFSLGEKVAALKRYQECIRALREELDVGPSPETVALYERIKESAPEAKSTARLTNLPIPLTSFVGRQREVAEIERMLTDGDRWKTEDRKPTRESPAAHPPPSVFRLVTCTGAGGSGKTRLAIRAATDLVNEFADGVWWVELAPVADADLVPQAVATALGVREVPNQPVARTLSLWLEPRTILLVLDNCEHLIGACARLAQELLSQCLNLKILATSREPLGLTAEYVWQVPTLSLPDAHQLPLPELMARYEGIQLFVERAVAVKSDFQLTAQNAFEVAQVCRRLDGIPLAIELAAARVKVLSPQEIAVRLNDRFDLLTSGNRTALPRQQTLRATLDWSYDLLTEEERMLFRRLSVFSGGFNLEAAERVCGWDGIQAGQVLDLVAHLVDKSLLTVVVGDGETRYGMLETIREYAGEKLALVGEGESLRNRHLRYFSELAKGAEPLLLTEQVTWFNRLDSDTSNLRAAIEWSMEGPEAGSGEKVELGLSLAGALTWFLESRARRETSDLLKRVLSSERAQSETLARAKGLSALGHLEWSLANLAEARSALEESLTLARKFEDNISIGWALAFLGAVAGFQGDYEAARNYLEESLAITPDSGVVAKNTRGVALGFLGDLPMHEGNYDQAQELYDQSIRLLRQVQSNNFLTYPLRRSGYAALHQGQSDRAVDLFKESLALNQKLGHQLGMTACLAALAAAVAARGKKADAIRLFGAVDLSLTTLNSEMFSPDMFEYERNLADAKLGLDEAACGTAWAKGHEMTLGDAIDHALRAAHSP